MLIPFHFFHSLFILRWSFSLVLIPKLYFTQRLIGWIRMTSTHGTSSYITMGIDLIFGEVVFSCTNVHSQCDCSAMQHMQKSRWWIRFNLH
jgi:hypothetical protein